jgi:glycyl-tRNA synthetase beta chain
LKTITNRALRETSVVLALADKLETLIGMFHIENFPTGDRDPFALRRHALGVIRLLSEKDVPIGLETLVNLAQQVLCSDGPQKEWAARMQANGAGMIGYGVEGRKPETTAKLLDFIYERMVGSLREQGFSAQEVDAVLALRPQRLADVAQRLQAVRAFAALPEAPALAAANKRIGNILKKSDTAPADEVLMDLFKEPAEEVFRLALANAAAKANPAYAAGDYTDSLLAWAELKTPVDAFFDNVMVNDEDLSVRRNRLGLLKQLHDAMNRVADLSRLAA